MNAIKKTADELQGLLKNDKSQNVEKYTSDLTSVISLLELPSPSLDQLKTLSDLLRKRLQDSYLAELQVSLKFAVEIIKFLHNEKITPLMKSCDHGRANLWAIPASSVLSGILDFLEKQQTRKARQAIASAVHPTICAFYFADSLEYISAIDGNLLSNAYMLLGETVVAPGADFNKLRDLISSRRLGRTIFETHNFLVLESIINLLGHLMPALKGGKEKRNQFLQQVFDNTLFKDSERILRPLEVIKRDWSVSATKIIRFLAESDGRFPQPFQVFDFHVESMSLTAPEPMFVDNLSFVVTLDQDGKLDSLVILFTTVSIVKISGLNAICMKVELVLDKPPILGGESLYLPRRNSYSVSFSISKSVLHEFGKCMKQRNLKLERPAHKKLSQAPSELLPDMMRTENDKEWEEKAAKLTNMARHGVPDAPKESSPQPERSASSNLGEYQNSDAVVDIPSDKLPSTVFLDQEGNFSIHPPQHMDPGCASATLSNILTNQESSSEDEEPILRHKRSTKSKVIIESEDDDELPSKPEVGALKLNMFKKKLEPDMSPLFKVGAVISQNFQKGIKKEDSNNLGVKSTHESKKRTLQDVASDLEAPPPAKRHHENLPPSVLNKRKATTYGGKGRQPLVASPTKNKVKGFEDDFAKTSKPIVERPQTRAKDMKRKDGKKIVPKPRPVTVKKKGERVKAPQPKADQEFRDADTTLVEKSDPFKSSEAQAVDKNVTMQSNKSNKAPWEIKDFMSLKVETAEDPSVTSSPIDFFSKIEIEASDVEYDLPMRSEGIFGDEYIDFEGHLKSETISSPEKSPVRSEPVWIDLTNSPERVTRKLTTSKRVDHQQKHGIDQVPRKVEKLPIRLKKLESPHRMRNSEVTSPKRIFSPIHTRQLPLGDRKLNKAIQTGRYAEKDAADVRSRIPKEQKGIPGSRGGTRVKDDPDSRIAEVIGEIAKVLTGKIQNRFSTMSTDYLRMKRELKTQVADELGKMNHELFTRYNKLVDLQEETTHKTAKLVHALGVFERACEDSVQSYQDVLEDFQRNRLDIRMDIIKESDLEAITRLSERLTNIEL